MDMGSYTITKELGKYIVVDQLTGDRHEFVSIRQVSTFVEKELMEAEGLSRI